MMTAGKYDERGRLNVVGRIQATLSVSIAAGNCGHTTRESYKKTGKWPDHIDRKRACFNAVFAGEGVVSTSDVFNDVFAPLAEKRYEEELAKPAKKRHVKRLDDNYVYDPYKYFVKSKRYSQNVTKGSPMVGLVFQAGNAETGWPINERNVQAFTAYFKDVYEDFKERNPDFKVVTAAVHFDEATPHLHIDGIPMAKDKKSAYGVAAALSPMIRQHMSAAERKKLDAARAATKGKMGEIAWWQDEEMTAFEAVSKRHGIDRVKGREGQGKRLDIWAYKAGRALVDRERGAVDQEIDVYKRKKLAAVDREADHILQEKMEDVDRRVDAFRSDRMACLDDLDKKISVSEKQLADSKKQLADSEKRLADIDRELRERQEKEEREKAKRLKQWEIAQRIPKPDLPPEKEPAYLRGLPPSHLSSPGY